MERSLLASVEELEGGVVVRLEGHLEDATPGALGQMVDRLPPPGKDPVTVDLTGVGRLGGRGVAALATLVGGLEERGHEVRIHTPSEAHREAIRVFGAEVQSPADTTKETLDLVERLGDRTLRLRESVLRFTHITRLSLVGVFRQTFGLERSRWDLTLAAVVHMGVTAIPLVSLIAFLIGFILALQAAPLLRPYGQEILVADLVGVSLTREIGPLLTAVLVAGRSGSSLTAEIGTMRVSEEVDALEVMGVQPISFLVSPRLRALVLALPALTVMADVVGILGGLAVAGLTLDLGPQKYLDQTLQAVQPKDVIGGLLKALVFAVVIVSVAAHQGLETTGSAAGVGRRTTRSVVQAIIWIIIVDAFFTALLYLIEA